MPAAVCARDCRAIYESVDCRSVDASRRDGANIGVSSRQHFCWRSLALISSYLATEPSTDWTMP
jgi:hypothetical protein